MPTHRPDLRRLVALMAAMLVAIVVPGTAVAQVENDTDNVLGQAADETVLEAAFDDGTTMGFYGRGDASVAASTDVSRSPDGSLAVTERADTWQGPAVAVGDVLERDVEYTASAWVLLPEGAEASAFNLAVVREEGGEQNFEWISGLVDGVAGDWVELSGTYTFEAGDATELYVEADTLVDFFVDDVRVTAPEGSGGEVVLETGFEDGLGEWVARNADDTPPTVATSDDARTGEAAALVSDRDGQGDGIGRDVTDVVETGTNYEISTWVKFADGGGPGDVSLTMQRTNGDEDAFDTIASVTGITAGEWTEVSAEYRMAPAEDLALLYLETAFPDGTSDAFLVDDVEVSIVPEPEIEDLTPIKDTLEPGFGVAIDARETVGAPRELTLRHFGQVTPENHMKPNAFYDADRNFVVDPNAIAIMDMAVEEDLDVYGHTLLWYQQTPEWFFQRDDGTPLTDSAADQQVLRERLRTHVFAVAEAFADSYGAYGAENPIVAFDVVNEVVSDSPTPDGLRRSRWYEVLGEDHIDLAFQYAEEAFNETYAAPDADRPVKLAINDFNTEQDDKRDRFVALVERMQARNVPVDIFGHQFHVTLNLPVSAMEEALDDAAQLGLEQVVSELDVATGVPVTEAALIDQGYFFRDAFEVFRDRDDLFSVTMWGLTDDRSWRVAEGAPLVFDEDLQAKPAHTGAVGADLPPRLRSATVFATDEELGVDSPEWQRLPLLAIDEQSSFQLRWSEDALTAYVTVTTDDDGGSVTFDVGDDTFTVQRDGSGDVEAETSETDDGWDLAAELPLEAAAIDDVVAFDVRVTRDGTTNGWNTEGVLGELSLVEQLSYTEAPEASAAPEIDGTVDDAWDAATAISTDVAIQGDDGVATAEVRTLWREDTLYVLAEVADDTPDVSSSNAYEHDSFEIFLDVGNAKNGPYRAEDAQMRINRENEVTFGTGDTDAQAERLTSATASSDDGYVVEAAIDLLDQGGAGTFHGYDVQVNDGDDGTRIGVRNWADPTGRGYLTTARWGVVQLVEDTDGGGGGGPSEPGCDTVVEGEVDALVLTEGTTCLAEGARVAGRVVVKQGASLVADGASIRGYLHAWEPTDVLVQDTFVHGDVHVRGATGSVRLTDNRARRSLFVYGNNPSAGAPVVSANTVGRHLWCFSNVPAATDDGRPNTAGRSDRCPAG